MGKANSFPDQQKTLRTALNIKLRSNRCHVDTNYLYVSFKCNALRGGAKLLME